MNIKINGKQVTTNCLTLHNLRLEHYDYEKNIITILNGFQTFDDYKISENDEVSFIEKGKMPSQDEFEKIGRASCRERVS